MLNGRTAPRSSALLTVRPRAQRQRHKRPHLRAALVLVFVLHPARQARQALLILALPRWQPESRLCIRCASAMQARLAAGLSPTPASPPASRSTPAGGCAGQPWRTPSAFAFSCAPVHQVMRWGWAVKQAARPVPALQQPSNPAALQQRCVGHCSIARPLPHHDEDAVQVQHAAALVPKMPQPLDAGEPLHLQ